MSTTTTVCDACREPIPDGSPSFYLCTKRTAPSVDADLCSLACVGALAARLQRREYTPREALEQRNEAP